MIIKAPQGVAGTEKPWTTQRFPRSPKGAGTRGVGTRGAGTRGAGTPGAGTPGAELI